MSPVASRYAVRSANLRPALKGPARRRGCSFRSPPPSKPPLSIILIRQKRIRNLFRHLPAEYEGKSLHVALTNPDRHVEVLLGAGLPPVLSDGDTILPAINGPISRFNAEGKNRIRRDLKKETVYRQIEWTWTEKHGNQEVERSDFRYVPYERYPREFIPPPSVELQVRRDVTGQLLVTSPAAVWAGTADVLLHSINLYLEIFGEATILDQDLGAILKAEVRRLNWSVLPAGQHPWPKLQGMLQPVISRAKAGKQGVIRHRLEVINARTPDFVAVGHGGFAGYLVFGFPAKNVFVLESILYGNATYVFEQNWEALSQMTKADVLAGRLQKQRIIHAEGWAEAVNDMLD